MRAHHASSASSSEGQSGTTSSTDAKKDRPLAQRTGSGASAGSTSARRGQDATAQAQYAELTRRESLTPRAEARIPTRDVDADANLADESGTDTEDSDAENQGEGQNDNATADRRREERSRATSDELRVEKLREAVLRSQGMSNAAKLSPDQIASTLAQRRISPIKEEPRGTMSPTLDEAFASPWTATRTTTSTESTNSARTVKGSVPPTPGTGSVRTPSYPFPYIPGTPNAWPSNFHRPFTTLSPTVSARNVRDVATPRERAMSSGPSTPAASVATFMPGGGPGTEQVGPDDDYPAPNLYDLVLALSCEPGLDAWWAVVVNAMRDWYGAERATLAIPADASELETVPWGQKATYNSNGSLDIAADVVDDRKQPFQHDLPLRKVHDEPEKSLTASKKSSRPGLTARHSYAGFERDRNAPTTPLDAPSSARTARPRGPQRTASHAPTTSTRNDRSSRDQPQATDHGRHPLRNLLSMDSRSDPDFSSVAQTHQSGPYEAVFPTLRALDIEANPLLDSAGVIKVLERGKLVTLTRDYAVSTSSRGPSTEPIDSETEQAKKTAKPKAADAAKSAPKPPKMTRAQSDYFSRARLPTTYEEYEQFPASPWAQSPAPSPAIQADPEDNPFFSSPRVDEDSFNPDDTAPNYATYGQVAAIGVDKASTIVHIPLIHPVLSQVLPPLQQEQSPDEKSKLRRSSTAERVPNSADAMASGERRAPIAVISFLSDTVPYPQSLTQSLKLVAPHLATTFANAAQYTNAMKQAVNIRHRRMLSNTKVGFAPLPNEPESLEDLLRLDTDDINASMSGSITSPSDYSAQSRFSPAGSLQGTPGWDMGSVGFTRSVVSTPAHVSGLEVTDSYFEAKKRATFSPKDTSSALSKSPRIPQTGRASPSLDSRKRSSQGPPKENLDASGMKSDHSRDKGKHGAETQSYQPDSNTPRKSSLKSSQLHPPERKQYTQLHSFGADFQSSFSTLPATTIPSVSRPEDQLGHVRSNSVEIQDMLPPSEKLLRIIIDALPVQIFMAAPSDGSITWANSKYLAYRGQESRQIVQDPWHTIHADDISEYMDLWNRSLRTGVQLSHKIRLQRFDGQYRWFFVKIAPLKDKRQNIVHWVGTNMDFHEQYIAETNAARQQETAASEAKYRAVANSSPQIVFAATKERGVTFCNSQWSNYSGQTEDQARGVGFMDHVHPEDLEKCKLPSFNEDGTPAEVPISMHARARTSSETVKESSSSDDSYESLKVVSPGSDTQGIKREVHHLPQAKLSELATTGILKVVRDDEGRPSYSTEVRLRNKEGKYRWHLVRVLRSELKDSNNDDQTWYGTCTDINDHKLLEQTLKETMDAKSRFLSNMSHEIRTPLNGITGMVNFLIDSNLTTEQMEHVNIIRNSTEGLRDLINDILDLSKVEAGMITLSMDWLHVRSLIEEVNDLTSALALDKGLELNYIVEENVPPMVKGDRFRIRQVLLNVIGNAIKFTQSGEVFIRCQRLEMDLGLLSSNETLVRFEVIDTGSGFTEKEAQFLFKRFSQIDGSSTRQHGGSGLGLAISMQLVELHGGHMTATSVPGKGSTFTFSIKFGLPNENDRPPLVSMPTSTSALPTPGMFEPGTKWPTSAMPSPAPQTLIKQLATLNRENSSPPGYTSSPGTDQLSSISPASSVPSTSITQTSSHSERSSQSSFAPDLSQIPPRPPIALRLPGSERSESYMSTSKESDSSADSDKTVQQPASPTPKAASLTASSPAPAVQPPLLSILVVCPLQWSREATVKHIEMTLPKTVPQNITARADVQDSLNLIQGDDSVIFTHVVLSLPESDQVVTFMELLFESRTASARASPIEIAPNTSLVIVCDLSQRREIMQRAPGFDYGGLQRDRRLRFVFKPLKPSKLAVVFDPQRERDVSSNRALEGAQAVAVSQKQVYEEMKRRLGGKGFKVLLVEDNKTNQMVLLKFLKRAEIQAEAVMDGAQCTEKVFANDYGTYAIILCDLHMPNKDGYQTCKEIRRWERKHQYPHLPIVALSANVLGDVYAKCVQAGFNNYVTKPVDFKELSEVMMTFLDPEEPGKPHPFMKMKDEGRR